MEQLVTNIEVVRDYVLCADTVFTTGLLTTNGDILLGDMPLTLRKNMRIHCGDIGGSSDNNCVIRGGSFGVVSFGNNFEETTVNDNVLVQGVTFQDIALYGMLLGLPGNFRFVDCIFVVCMTCALSFLFFSILSHTAPIALLILIGSRSRTSPGSY
jgi:hypothetical protein